MAKEIHEQPEVVGRTLAHYVNFAAGTGRAAARAAVRLQGPAAPLDLGLRHRLSRRAGRRNTGSSGWPASRSRSTSPPSSATARRRWSRAALRSSCRSPARRPTPWPRCATPRRNGQHIALGRQRARPRPWRGKAPSSRRRSPGSEIGVASTKAFTCQLAVLLCLAIAAGRARGTLSSADEKELVDALIGVPGLDERGAASARRRSRRLARELSKARDVLYLGRGTSYPAGPRRRAEAEGDLLHPRRRLRRGRAEARPDRADRRDHAGHRDRPARRLFEKTVSNMQEVAARGGRIILITDEKGAEATGLERWRRSSCRTRTRRRADRACRPGAAPRLPHGRVHGEGRRPAAQSREIGHGGVSAQPPRPRDDVACDRAEAGQQRVLANAAEASRREHDEPAGARLATAIHLALSGIAPVSRQRRRAGRSADGSGARPRSAARSA